MHDSTDINNPIHLLILKFNGNIYMNVVITKNANIVVNVIKIIVKINSEYAITTIQSKSSI